MPFDERSFDNPYLNTKPQSSDPKHILTEKVKSRIQKFIHQMLGVIRERLNDGSISSKDTSVYTGLSGIALTLIKIEETGMLGEDSGKEGSSFLCLNFYK